MTGSGWTEPTETALNRRWVIRYRLPNGSATDVIGWLDAIRDGQLELTLAGGSPRTVSPATVVAARPAPAAAGGPDPRRVTPADLEMISRAGWLAASEPLGEWTLRAGGGFTGRANSCLAVGQPGVGVATAATRIVDYATKHGLAPMAQVITGSEPEQWLRDLGWTETHVPTSVLVVRLASLLGNSRPPGIVTVSEVLDPAWSAAYRRSRPEPVAEAVLALLLSGQPPQAFARVEREGHIVGIARGHLGSDWLGLAAIWTDPAHRRQGVATAMMLALGHWAARRGARYGSLQVARANRSAAAAYGRMGFVHHHDYGYLRPPVG